MWYSCIFLTEVKKCSSYIRLIIFFLFLALCSYFSHPLCQPPNPTTSQPGGKANITRAAESHRLCHGFPHGGRRGVNEVGCGADCHPGLPLAQTPGPVGHCVTWSIWFFVIFWRPVQLFCTPTFHKLSRQRYPRLPLELWRFYQVSYLRSQYDRSLDLGALWRVFDWCLCTFWWPKGPVPPD